MARDNSSSVTFASEVAMSENRITGLGDPTISTDAATKGYVDSIRPSQLYAACECVDPAIIPGFDSPHKQINNFKKIGDVNFLRVSSTGITISTIGVYDIFLGKLTTDDSAIATVKQLKELLERITN